MARRFGETLNLNSTPCVRCIGQIAACVLAQCFQKAPVESVSLIRLIEHVLHHLGYRAKLSLRN